MQRRSFLQYVAISGGGSLLPACKSAVVLPRYSMTKHGEMRLPVADLKNKHLLVAHPDSGLPISVLALDDGRYTACLMSCTHMKCETVLHQSADESGYVCPCHGARFDLQGKVRRGPADQDLASYSIRLDAGMLYINLMTSD